MDSADVTDFSPESLYTIISLPALYSNYLREYPEQLHGREEYLSQLYRKTINYVESFSNNETDSLVFFYLRQLSITYIETQDSVPYKVFQQKLLLSFAPDIYIHSQVVGKAAAALCKIIMDEEPEFFDDIDFIRALPEPEKKKQAVLDYAMNCGVFHDIGKINFISLFSQTGRQLFEDEFEIVQLHTVVGAKLLSLCPSTEHYAAVVLGHHSWYDGSHGYPDSYKRLECPYRQMVDVIGLIDWMDNMLNPSWLYGNARKSYEEIIQEAIASEGKRFSPLLTARLRDLNVAERIRQTFQIAREQSYRLYYETSKNDTMNQQKEKCL